MDFVVQIGKNWLSAISHISIATLPFSSDFRLKIGVCENYQRNDFLLLLEFFMDSVVVKNSESRKIGCSRYHKQGIFMLWGFREKLGYSVIDDKIIFSRFYDYLGFAYFIASGGRIGIAKNWLFTKSQVHKTIFVFFGLFF